jgi:hypothetical protein
MVPHSEKMDPNQLMFDSLMLHVLEGQPQAPLQPAAPAPQPAESPLPPNDAIRDGFPCSSTWSGWKSCSTLPKRTSSDRRRGKPLKHIGWEVSEKLEYRPGRLVVNV